jgi:hypothetical protein
MALGEIKFLSAGEIDQIVARLNDYSLNRAWENWRGAPDAKCRRASAS